MGMTNQPAFNLRVFRLHVELQAEYSGADGKCLIRETRRLRETGRPQRNIELIAMPMQNRNGFEACQHGCAPVVGERQEGIANLGMS